MPNAFVLFCDGEYDLQGGSCSETLVSVDAKCASDVLVDNPALDDLCYKPIDLKPDRVELRNIPHATAVISIVLKDTDGDGLPDSMEEMFGTNPDEPDSDFDGMSDYEEVCYDGDCTDYSPYPAGGDTDANLEDTDGDGYTDKEEVDSGYNPLDPNDPAPANHPPVITSEPVTGATADELYAYDVEATDEDGDILTYSLTEESPEDMTIDDETGLIEWTPTFDQVGAHDVIVEVEDGNGGTDSQSFTINVAEEVDLIPPVINLKVIPYFVKKVNTVTIKLQSDEELGEIFVAVKQWGKETKYIEMKLDDSTEDHYDYVGTFDTSQGRYGRYGRYGFAFVIANVTDLAGNESIAYDLFFIWRRWW